MLHQRSRRAKKRVDRPLFVHPPPVPAKRLALTPTSSRASSSRASSISILNTGSTTDEESSMTASIGEPLFSDYSVHELHSTNDDVEPRTQLAARIELLEAQVKHSSDTKTITLF